MSVLIAMLGLVAMVMRVCERGLGGRVGVVCLSINFKSTINFDVCLINLF
jgi:hypothetical protein